MKLEVKCEVESEMILPRRLELKAHSRTYILDIDKNGKWNMVTIIADVADPSTVRWGLESIEEPLQPNQAPVKVVGTFDTNLFESVVSDLQCLESTLATFFPLRQINWRYPTYQIVYEQGDEQTLGHLGALHFGRQKPRPMKVDEAQFISTIGLALKSQSLVVVESFWREGEREWVSGRFINAFFNYYFVIEGLYCNRKTKNGAIEKEFLASAILRSSMEQFLTEQHAFSQFRKLTALFSFSDRMPTVEDFLKLLVSVRGKLHHFQNNPDRKQGSPLTHDDYEGIAYLARCLAHKGLLIEAIKIVPINFGASTS